MKRNVGKSDMIVRFVLGALFLGLSLADMAPDELLDDLLTWTGIYLLISGIVRFCLLYYFLGIGTYRKGKAKMY